MCIKTIEINEEKNNDYIKKKARNWIWY